MSKDLNFRVVVSFDEESYEPGISYINIRRGKVHHTEEIVEGLLFADYDENGRTLGMEILDPISIETIHLLGEDEEPEVMNKIQKLVSNVSDFLTNLKAS